MYIRCPDCKSTTRVPFALQGRSVHCIECGRTHDLKRADELGSTAEERSRRAIAYAEEHNLDLATAYSRLLGIVSSGPKTDITYEPMLQYDPGFSSAVIEGHLTLQQAVERGDRVQYASRLAQRHNLPMDLAFLATDNRIALGQARRSAAERAERRAVGRPDAWPSSRASRGGARAVWLSLSALGLLAIAVLTSVGPTGDPTATDPGRTRRVGQRSAQRQVQLLQDERGKVTSVSAPDPSRVLLGFCEPEPGRRRCEPLEIRAGASGAPGLRWGIFRVSGTEGEWRAIEIRRQDTLGRWAAGDGTRPVAVVAVPDSPPGTMTVPVNWNR